MGFSVVIDQNNTIVSSSEPAIVNDGIVMFFSGVVYNEEYIKSTHRITAHSTAEMFLEILKSHADIPSIISKINGIFSLVIVDDTTKTIVAFRDRNGLGSLRYSFDINNSITFRDSVFNGNNYMPIQEVPPGQILIFLCGEVVNKITYNDYEKQGNYWLDIRDKYLVTKYRSKFKTVVPQLSHLNTDQIIENSPLLLETTNYPEKVEMFKFLQCVRAFEQSEYEKLNSLLRRAVSVITSFVKDEIYVFLNNDVSTICLVHILKSIKARFKTFSVHKEFEEAIPPRASIVFDTDHTKIFYDPVTIMYEIGQYTEIENGENIIPTFVFCKHIGTLSECPQAILPTLANELFSKPTNRLSMIISKPVLETSVCTEKFNVQVHYPYADIHVVKFALFLNAGYKNYMGKTQSRCVLKIVASHEIEDKELIDIIFSDRVV